MTAPWLSTLLAVALAPGPAEAVAARLFAPGHPIARAEIRVDAGGPRVPLAWIEKVAGVERRKLPSGESALCRGAVCVPIDDGPDPLVPIEPLAKALGATAVFDAETNDLLLRVPPAPPAVATAPAPSPAAAPDAAPASPDAFAAPLDLVLPDLAGNPVPFDSFRGKKTIVFAWASWCACREALPKWQAFAAKHAERPLAVVAVAVDVQGARAAKPYVDAAKATYPVLVDAGGALGERFRASYVPFTVLLDEDGRVVRGPRFFETRSEEAFDEMTRFAVQGEKALDTKPAKLPFDATGFESPEASLRLEFAARLLEEGDRDGALRNLRAASRAEPTNLVVLKQIWAIESPERFYSGAVDFAWQEERLKERAPGR